MNLFNTTRMVAGYTTSIDKTGREFIVVVVKATFGIPHKSDAEVPLLEAQLPLITCDQFSGEPGISAPIFEMEYVPRKPRCDVLLNGCAYAPGGKPTDRVTVGLKVGAVNKKFDVVGNRIWKAGILYQGISAIEPFVKQSISYDVAFGGVDRTSKDPAKYRWYSQNHAGKGYYHTTDPKLLDGMPLPNTEEVGHPVNSPSGQYKPMACGPLGRAWQPRIQWAGTYDQKWMDHKRPFLPDDFDERYFQSAPDDQQTDTLEGVVAELTCLTPQQYVAFTLPRLKHTVILKERNGKQLDLNSRLDTVIIEPCFKRFSAVWRSCSALRRSLFDVLSVTVSPK